MKPTVKIEQAKITTPPLDTESTLRHRWYEQSVAMPPRKAIRTKFVFLFFLLAFAVVVLIHSFNFLHLSSVHLPLLTTFNSAFGPTPYKLTKTRLYNRHFPPISNEISPDRVLSELDNHLKLALNESASKEAYEILTASPFHPEHAISIHENMVKHGYVNNASVVRPLRFKQDFARVPSAARNAAPMSIHVFRNAYLGKTGVVIEPLTKTVYDVAGGCCSWSWPSYNKDVQIRNENVRSVKEYEGQVVLALNHHHSQSNHHVLYEVLPRYLLVAPLLEARPDILVALDNSSISPLLLRTLGLDQKRILKFSGSGAVRDPQWRFASVVLVPIALHGKNEGQYPADVILDVAGVLTGVVKRRKTVPKRPVMVVLERAKKRYSEKGRRACDEQRCLANFAEVLTALKEEFNKTFEIIVYRATDDFRVAIPLFEKASVIVGVHGGGFQNIMYCKKNTTVIHIGWMPGYRSIAWQFGLKYHLYNVTDLDLHVRGYVLKDVGAFVRNVSRAIEEDGVLTVH